MQQANENRQLSLDQAFSLALKQHSQGDLKQAREIYNRILDVSPEHYPCLNNLGLLESQGGNPEKAVSFFKKVLEIKEDFPETHNNLGSLLRVMKKPQEALSHLQRALELKEDYFDAWSNLARAYTDLRQPSQALDAARKGLEIKADSVLLEMICGQSLMEFGKSRDAAVRFRRALALKPGDREIMLSLVKALRSDRDFVGAEETLRRLIDNNKAEAFEYNMLGVILQDQGRQEEAIAAFNQALALEPEQAEPYNNRAVALKRLKRFDEAIQSFERALEINPQYCEALNNQGNLFSSSGDLDSALERYTRAVEINPDFLEGQANIALTLADKGEFKAARDHLLDPISKNPDSAFLNKAYASVLVKLEDYATAETHLRKALRFLPRDPEVLNLMGNVLNQLGYDREAEVMLYRALDCNPRLTGAYNNLGNICAALGRRGEARSHFFHALEIDPENPAVLRHLCAVHSFEKDDPLFRRLVDMENRKEEFSKRERVELLYALSKAYEDLQEYEKSFDLLIEASSLYRSFLDYNPEDDEKQSLRLANIFTRECISSLRGLGFPSELPVFIVGMPRSGTSLTEQILASHPDVFGAGELRLMQNSLEYGIVINKTHIDGVSVENSDISKALSAREGLFEIGKRYVCSLRPMATDTLRITDKMPGNFAKLGIITLAMPGAKIIHVRRNPVDTCLSCFRTRFATGQEWSYDLKELGRYYNAYARIMQHWREVIPEAFMEIDYEDLVRDFEPNARRLVEYCGLPWDEACVRFYETKRSVKTASLAQVRKPIYSSSMEKWRRYEKFLQPLLDTLDPELLREYAV